MPFLPTSYSIWLTDLASRLPQSVRLEGLDVSFDATPPPQWLPGNVTLREWDLKYEPPEDLIGSYDVVHIRNFALVLMDDDVQKVIGRLFKILSMSLFLIKYIYVTFLDIFAMRSVSNKRGAR